MDLGKELRTAVREHRLGNESQVYIRNPSTKPAPESYESQLQKYVGAIQTIVTKTDPDGYNKVIIEKGRECDDSIYDFVKLECIIETEGESFGETVKTKQHRGHSFVERASGNLYLVNTDTGDTPDLRTGIRGNVFENDAGTSSLVPSNGTLHLYTGTVIELVLCLGADINAKNSFGETPLMQATHMGYVDICAWLCSQEKVDVDAQSECKATALMLAVEATSEDHLEVVKLLLKHGANPNMRNKWGTTALPIGAFTCNKAACELLLKHGASKTERDIYNKSPGYYATREHCGVTDSGKARYDAELEAILEDS